MKKYAQILLLVVLLMSVIAGTALANLEDELRAEEVNLLNSLTSAGVDVLKVELYVLLQKTGIMYVPSTNDELQFNIDRHPNEVCQVIFWDKDTNWGTNVRFIPDPDPNSVGFWLQIGYTPVYLNKDMSLQEARDLIRDVLLQEVPTAPEWWIDLILYILLLLL